MDDRQEKHYLSSLDRRISEHDAKLSNSQRDYTELTHEIKELMNRINNGVSPSVNEVRKENSEIKLQLADLSHSLELNMRDMKDMVKQSSEHTRAMVENFDKARLQPVEREHGYIKKTFIYGVIGALTVFAGNKIFSVLWERVFKSSSVSNVIIWTV